MIMLEESSVAKRRSNSKFSSLQIELVNMTTWILLDSACPRVSRHICLLDTALVLSEAYLIGAWHLDTDVGNDECRWNSMSNGL